MTLQPHHRFLFAFMNDITQLENINMKSLVGINNWKLLKYLYKSQTNDVIITVRRITAQRFLLSLLYYALEFKAHCHGLLIILSRLDMAVTCLYSSQARTRPCRIELFKTNCVRTDSKLGLSLRETVSADSFPLFLWIWHHTYPPVHILLWSFS